LIVLIIILASCSNSISASKHNKNLQAYYNYESAMKRNDAFTLKKAKYVLKEETKKAQKEEAKAREQAKIDAINRKIAELKKDNQ